MRPATILADVAVAVHPDDERYRDLVGKEVVVPFVERRVPVIADERVEMEFGTGALKITPGHDPTDFEIGRDHGLPELTVIGPDGLMNDAAGELAGLTQEEAAKRVLDVGGRARADREARELPPRGRRTASAATAASSRSSRRSGGAAMEELAAPAIGAARAEGRVHFTSQTASRVYLDWRRTSATGASPARSGGATGSPSGTAPTATSPSPRPSPTRAPSAARPSCAQDEDVLDTWFSSAL